MRRPAALLLALSLTAPACGDPPRNSQPEPPTETTLATAKANDLAPQNAKRPSSPPVASSPVASSVAPSPVTTSLAGGASTTAGRVEAPAGNAGKPRAPIQDGALTAKGVFERAQKAFADSDNAAVFHCVAPPIRKRWLDRMVFSAEFATTGRTREQGARHAKLEELRAILDRYGATLSVEERLAGLTLDELQAALMRKVEDPTGLYADLLGWSARHGSRTDPMQALAEPRLLNTSTSNAGSLFPEPRANADAASPRPSGPSGMAGVLGRLASGSPLGEIKVRGDTATASLRRDGGVEDEQRFVRVETAWFLGE